MERRAYTRQPLLLDAQVSSADGVPLQCKVRDFCLGGMFLKPEGDHADDLPVSVNDSVSIEFTTETQGKSQAFSIHARVAGLFKGGMGVEFKAPDPAALVALQSLATEARNERASGDEGGRFGGDMASVIKECHDALSAYLSPRVESLRDDAETKLFNASRVAESNVEQTECLDAIRELEQIGEPLQKFFLDEILGHMQHLGEPRAALREPSGEEETLSELSLVDSGEFADWLTTKAIVTKAEAQHGDALFLIEGRFSYLAGTKIDEENNPVGLAGICHTFHDALQGLALSKQARNAIFEVFDDTIIGELDHLYEDLNRLLVERDILPDLKRPVPKVGKKPHRGPVAPTEQPQSDEPPPNEHTDATNAAWDGVDTGTHGYSGAPAGHPAMPGQTPSYGHASAAHGVTGSAQPAGLQPGSAAPPSGLQPGTAAAPPSGLQPGTAAVPPAGLQPGAAAPPGSLQPGTAVPADGVTAGPGQAAASGVAPAVNPAMPGATPPMAADVPAWQVPAASGEMTGRGHYLGPQMHAAFNTAQALMGLQRQLQEPSGQHAAAGPTFGHEEVRSAVSELQREQRRRPNGLPEGVGLKSRVMAALRARYGVNDPRELSKDERNAIDVIENLVSSILDDALLSESIRPRMRRLELPLLNAAMQDAAFFNAPHHPARQVVNQLGQLHMVGANGVEPSELGAQVDPLIDKIVARSDTDPEVFPEVLTDLDTLVAEQSRLRDENMRAVIEKCEQQQALVRARHADRAAPPAPRKELPPEWQQWLSRAKRLEVGDRLMVGCDGPSPQQNSVAWIDEDQSTYVLVDAQGNKTATLSLQELAMQLRRGTADVLQRDSISAVDRGLYEMLRKMHAEVFSQATRDTLTELVNRKEFELRVAEAVISARREHLHHTLWLMDLDDFAAVNKTCGKKPSDKLLRGIGRSLRKRLESGSFACRFDGDQFGVLIPSARLGETRRIVERHRRMVEKFRASWKGEHIKLTASFGLVEISDQTKNAEQALDEASQACRKAKEAGGNRVEVFEEQVTFEQSDEGRDQWVGRIQKLLGENALELRCQRIVPVVADDDSTKPHYEVLLGVPDKQGKIMLPADFIHASELYGQMPDVDRWVIRTTFEWMAANKRKLLKLGGCAINLSGQSLSEESALTFVLEQFEETKVPPAKVIFEITESTEIGSLSNAENFINVMREYGCRFSLDDFGSSHSSYAYLKQLPVDFVKIDGMFVRDIVDSENDYAMVKSINEIGHFMGKKTVAEFVENDAILEKLREIGVDYAQGFAVGKPHPLAELG